MPSDNASWMRTGLLLAAAGLAVANAGCLPKSIERLIRKDKPVYRASERLDQDTSPSKLSGELDRAHEQFRQLDYASAARSFERIYDNTDNSPSVAEEAMYYHAECERLRNRLTSAEGLYKKHLHEFPSGAFKQQGCQRLYDIAIHWLKPTFEDLDDAGEKPENQRTFVVPAVLRVNLDSSKPTFDAESRALQALEVVHYSDMTGPLADKAIYLAGFVKFFREDYREADHYFTALLQYHKDSELAPRACEMAIKCKTLGAGGAAYDGRKVAEARQLIDTAMRAYPDLTKDEQGREKMMMHLEAVTAAQAEKDLHRAEFWERTRHPGSAYFIYELMKRRYPNTRYALLAEERMARLKPAMEKAAAGEADDGVLDRMQRRWNRLWGLSDQDLRGGASGGASPQALPAGFAPGQ